MKDKEKPVIGGDIWKKMIIERLSSIMKLSLKEGKDIRANTLHDLILELEEYFKHN